MRLHASFLDLAMTRRQGAATSMKAILLGKAPTSSQPQLRHSSGTLSLLASAALVARVQARNADHCPPHTCTHKPIPDPHYTLHSLLHTHTTRVYAPQHPSTPHMETRSTSCNCAACNTSHSSRTRGACSDGSHEGGSNEQKQLPTNRAKLTW